MWSRCAHGDEVAGPVGLRRVRRAGVDELPPDDSGGVLERLLLRHRAADVGVERADGLRPRCRASSRSTRTGRSRSRARRSRCRSGWAGCPPRERVRRGCPATLVCALRYFAPQPSYRENEPDEGEDLARELFGGVLVALAVGAVVGERMWTLWPHSPPWLLRNARERLRALGRAFEQSADRSAGARHVAEHDAVGRHADVGRAVAAGRRPLRPVGCPASLGAGAALACRRFRRQARRARHARGRPRGAGAGARAVAVAVAEPALSAAVDACFAQLGAEPGSARGGGQHGQQHEGDYSDAAHRRASAGDRDGSTRSSTGVWNGRRAFLAAQGTYLARLGMMPTLSP